jgi:6-phosphogluconolactonase
MPMTMEIEVLDDPARACAAMLVGAAAAGDDIVLTGGSTPRRAYEEFVAAVRAVDVDISAARFWFGDERCVGPDDERSNFRMASEALFAPLSDRFTLEAHRMKGELGPDAGAEDYEAQLAAAGTPEFDLLMLGVGPDGHTASLFPGTPVLAETRALAAPVYVDKLESWRVTLTAPVLSAAAHVLITTVGAEKADALATALTAAAGAVPIQLVRAIDRRWLVDRVAAQKWREKI